MEGSKETIEKLAKAWLAEAKRLRSRAICDCGCGEHVSVARARFKPGHDARLLKQYRVRIQEILGSN
jgi:hypothetical protein